MKEHDFGVNMILPLPSSLNYLKYYLIQELKSEPDSVNFTLNKIMNSFFENQCVTIQRNLYDVDETLFCNIEDMATLDNIKTRVYNIVDSIYRDMSIIVNNILKPGYFFIYLNIMNDGVNVIMTRECSSIDSLETSETYSNEYL